MKKLGAIVATILLSGTLVLVGTAQAGRVGKRQVNQQKRIHQGVKSTELTGKETRRLEKEQRRIHKAKHKAWSDGELSAKERVRLERMQDNASKHIYRLKHNDASR